MPAQKLYIPQSRILVSLESDLIQPPVLSFKSFQFLFANMSSPNLPTVGTRTTLDLELETFLSKNTELHLGGSRDFHDERSHHTKVFGFHSLPKSNQASIHDVEFTAIRGSMALFQFESFTPCPGKRNTKQGMQLRSSTSMAEDILSVPWMNLRMD